jgi:hypothetical protein
MNFLRNPNRSFTLLTLHSCSLPFVGSVTPERFSATRIHVLLRHEIHANLPVVSLYVRLQKAWNQGWFMGISALKMALNCCRSFEY